MQLSDSYGSFDTHIAMVYDILCHMTYVMKCHKMPYENKKDNIAFKITEIKIYELL